MYTATLDCGAVLSFEARSFLPRSGEPVPCRRHGYCVATGGREKDEVGSRTALRRARPRAQHELMEWLRSRPVTTFYALRRQRFTLRMLAAAERDGAVTIDFEAGRVYGLVALRRQPPA
jgi:hypothetical protein